MSVLFIKRLTLALPGPSSFELPDDVFYEGQTRPAKATKKSKKRVHATIDSSDTVMNPSLVLIFFICLDLGFALTNPR